MKNFEVYKRIAERSYAASGSEILLLLRYGSDRVVSGTYTVEESNELFDNEGLRVKTQIVSLPADQSGDINPDDRVLVGYLQKEFIIDSVTSDGITAKLVVRDD